MIRRTTGLSWAAAVLFSLTVSLPDSALGHHLSVGIQLPPTNAQCLSRFSTPCLIPAQISRYYELDPWLRRGMTGRGRTIAVVESYGSPTLRADLLAFDRAFGLPNPQLKIVTPLGPNQSSGQSDLAGGAIETALDVEWAHLIAPGARIVVLVSPVGETEGVQGLPQYLQLEQYALDHHLADVISQSWGATEDTLFEGSGPGLVARFHRFFQQAAARGVTAIASSGDNGASGFDSTMTNLLPRVAQFPADDPLVLSVGGTTLSFAGARGRAGSEVAWTLSGGGRSKTYAEPAYQRSLPGAVQALLAGRRGIPDVAFNGDRDLSPVLYYNQGTWETAAGTSLGAPTWAGIVALADQAAGRDLGSVNPALYRIAASTRYRRDFHDIIQGGNYTILTNGTLDRPAYQAGHGWDAVTGLGTPRIANLVADLIKAQ